MSERFDVLVVGAGPGGIAAATVAAEAGRRVCLIDDNPAAGGQIWRGLQTETAHNFPHGSQFIAWTTRLRNTSCAVWQGWRAIDQPLPGFLRLERGDERCDIEFENLILATGARERFLPFPGWTLPGVMGAGGLQALVKGGLDPRGKRIMLAGSGPLLLAVAAGLQTGGASVVGIYEQAPLPRMAAFGLSLLSQPGKLAEGARYRLKTLHVPYRTGSWVARVEGRGRVERVTLTDGRKQWTVACDWLGCGFNLVPNLELPLLLGCRIHQGFAAVDELQRTSTPGVSCIGELTGIGGIEKALLEGQIAGWAAAGRNAQALALKPARQHRQSFASRLERAFALRPELRQLSRADTLVCRCEDVAHSALEGCTSWRQAKLHTRCGMGACQGRVCGSATEFLFGWQHTGSRPPVFPAQVSTLAAEASDSEPVGR